MIETFTGDGAGRIIEIDRECEKWRDSLRKPSAIHVGQKAMGLLSVAVLKGMSHYLTLTKSKELSLDIPIICKYCRSEFELKTYKSNCVNCGAPLGLEPKKAQELTGGILISAYRFYDWCLPIRLNTDIPSGSAQLV